MSSRSRKPWGKSSDWINIRAEVQGQTYSTWMRVCVTRLPDETELPAFIPHLTNHSFSKHWKIQPWTSLENCARRNSLQKAHQLTTSFYCNKLTHTKTFPAVSLTLIDIRRFWNVISLTHSKFWGENKLKSWLPLTEALFYILAKSAKPWLLN